MQHTLSARPQGAARLARGSTARRGLRVRAAGLSPEQQAFLDRQARERSAAPSTAPTRGRSGSARPPSPRPTSRPTSAAPSYTPPSSSSSSSYSAPAAAPSGGLSAEQQAFLARRAQDSRSISPAPAPSRGRSGSARPSSRPSSRPAPAAPSYSAPAASYSAPAAPAPAGGLSAEQQAFMARRAAEGRSASPAAAPQRGRSNSARPSSARPSSRPAAPAPSYSAPAASYSAPAGGLSAEQQEFMARRAAEGRSASPAAAPQRGRSSSARPSSRPSSRPAPVAPSYTPAASSAPAPPAPSAPAAANGLSAEQQAFMARRASEGRSSSPAAAPQRGRSGSARPSSRQPTAAPAPSSYSSPPEPRVGDVEFARAALERTIADKPAVHPRDQTAAPPRPAAVPQPTGPSTGKWPDAAFFQATMNAFPAKAVCDAEEARCLIDAGYTLLDVRPELESNARGKIRGSVTIPCVQLRQQFDQASGQMVATEVDNPSFLQQVVRKFPRKDARILVACGNGKSYSIDVLEALDEEGYTNIVGLQGGINLFMRSFDARLNPKDGRPVARRQMKKLL